MARRKTSAQELEEKIRARTMAQRSRARAEGTLREVELPPQGVVAEVRFDAEWRPWWLPWGHPWRHRKDRRKFDHRAILAAVDAGATISATARKFGCSRKHVRNIRAARERGGTKRAISPMGPKK